MAGLARLAREQGHQVAGSDAAFYEPMASQLAECEIACSEGYEADCASRPADLYVIGNVARRGMGLIESILAAGRPFASAPAFAADHLLKGRKVAAVAGTHGKTTTASMLVHILTELDSKPSYLLGGVHASSGRSAHLDSGDAFVVEADEYDTAFFDKRPKFVHYWSNVAVITNIEFDHADIFRDLQDVSLQFSRLGRSVLPGGALIANGECQASMQAAACAAEWCETLSFGTPDGWHFADSGKLARGDKEYGKADVLPAGAHNRSNVLAAIAAAAQLGADPAAALASLASFELPARRLQETASGGGIVLIDDFAHHPTAIAATLAALAERYPGRRIVALLEIASNSMRAGCWRSRLAGSLEQADQVFAYGKGLDWNLAEALGETARSFADAGELAAAAETELRRGDIAVMLSNSDFGGVRKRLAAAVSASAEQAGTA